MTYKTYIPDWLLDLFTLITIIWNSFFDSAGSSLGLASSASTAFA
jgi:hypothetical protein